ncbi:hypothetical protein [Burkholderia anthina]|uniref:hypothetical protein n=1 Tax=Burkholderia anthina TaxID=179879 RepID=UPI0015894B2E|nr:hypothetical protein [Burkholderia anthina]
MKQSRTSTYTCPVSGQRIRVRHESGSLWMHADDAARLFGKKRAQFESVLRNLQQRREVDEEVDLLRLSNKRAETTLYLSHRAIISLGYSLNFGRVSAFRIWCSTQLHFSFDAGNRDAHGGRDNCAAVNERPSSRSSTRQHFVLA